MGLSIDNTNKEDSYKDYSVDTAEQPIHLDELTNNKLSKQDTPLPEDVFTSRKHSMDYFTVDGVILRTGYQNKRDWYLLPIREMLDNAIDFLWKYYKRADNTSIAIEIAKTDKLFRIKVRNTNYENIPVFPDLKSVFDFDMRYGSKQDVHIVSRGQLGDAMKQILSLGYVLLHTSDDGTAFTNKQWEEPLIIRHNKRERKIYLNVDKAQQTPHYRIDDSTEELASADTEIELVLPVIDEVHDNLDRKYIEQFCRKYSLFTTDISFKYRIIDDTNYTPVEASIVNSTHDMLSELVTIFSTTPQKGILNIDVPAVHPIATEWNNSNSIHSYKPEEFISRIVNVHDKSTSVYTVLFNFKEGSNIKKSPENEISIAELLSKPNRDKIIERLYKELKEVFDSPKELSLPYTTNTKKRKHQLVERIAKLYPDIDREKEPSYKLVRGVYNDGTIEYPFAFEIIAIPFKDPLGPLNNRRGKPKPTEFIGAVNYSISPKNNIFEGHYECSEYICDNIMEILERCGFQEWDAPKARLPSIIFANLITPRRDPHGYDKSSIDTQPFSRTIVIAVEKMAKDVKTYRADGWTFQRHDDYKTSRRQNSDSKVSVKDLLEQFLIKERGLPK